MQHIMYQLNNTGIAVEVHNGSTLFSGDAGGGESNIRKYMFDNDWVEAIVQMPSDEFFNTGILTYLWIMNKNKPADRKDRVILINGSNGWRLLKKSRGSKRREMLPEHRQKIVDALVAFEDCDIAKVYPKWHFYYNKQGIRLTEVDSEGKSVLDTLIKEDKTAYPLKAKKVVIGDTEIPLTGYATKAEANEVVSKLKSYNFKEDDFKVVCEKDKVYWVDEDGSVVGTVGILPTDAAWKAADPHSLGYGTFNIKTAKSKEFTNVVIEIVPVYTNDYEIIPYSPNEKENQQQIADFMARYVSKPFEYRDNVVGVEINFNKEFYVPETVESVDTIINELITLQKELKNEKFSFNDVLTKGLNPDIEMKDSGIEWLVEIPKHWKVKRVKDYYQVIMGQSPSSDAYNRDEVGIPFLQGNAEFGDLTPEHINWTTEVTKIAPRDSVLLSVRAPIGEVNIADKDYCIGRGLCAFIARNNKFLFYQLLSMKEILNMFGTGTTFKAITLSTINNMLIPIPHSQNKSP